MDFHSADNDSIRDYCDKYAHSHPQIATVMAALSIALAVLLLIIILSCARGYKSFLQRVVIFIVLSMLIEDSCRVGGVFFHPADNSTVQEQVGCEALGFVTLMFHWWTYLLCLVWMAYLLTVVCIQTRADSAVVAKFKSSMALRIMIEVGIIGGSLLGPAIVVLWVPFYEKHNEYGFNGYICTIKPSSNNTNSTIEAIAGQLYIYTPILLTGLFAVLLTVGVAVVYCTMSTKLKRVKEAIRNLIALSVSIIAFLLL